MSFGVSDGAGDFEYCSALAERAVRQARAPRDAVVPPHGRRPRALQPRGARSCWRATDAGPSLGDWLERAQLLARVRRAADRAAGRRRLVGRPAPDVELPGALPGRVLRQPRDARLPRPAALAHGAGRLASLRRGADRAVARPAAALDARRRRSRATTTTSRSRRAAASPSASTRSCSPPTPTRRWRCSPTRATASTSCSARSPTSPTRPCCTPTRACCRAAAAPGRAGTTTCSTSRPARSTVTYHMNRLQALRRRPRVLRHAQPQRGDRPREGDPHDRLRAPGLHRRGPGGAGAPRRDQRRNRTHYCGAYWGWGFHEDGVASAVRVAERLGGDAAVTHSAIYEGTIRHRRFAVAAHEFRHRIAMAYSTSTSCRGCSAAGCVAARPGARCASAAATTSATRRVPLADAVRDAGRERTGRAPAGPVRLLTHLRTFGHCFNPVSFYYCFAADGERSRRSSPRSPTRPGASATPTC